MPFWIAVHLPRLPLDALRPQWSDPAALPLPVMVLEQERVVSANRLAAREGVHVGLRRAGAQALVPHALQLERDPAAEARLLQALALTLLAFTPHVTLDLADEATVLTGDTVLGRGTTVVAHPDGQLGPYLDSLAQLRQLVEEGCADRILPGHGPVVDDPGAVLDHDLDHREERLDQVRAAVAAGHDTPRAVVEHVYADVDPVLWDAAELSVRAQLEYLQQS